MNLPPADRIPPLPWMTTAAIARLFAALMANGAAARFVGGCVRDSLLGRTVTDIDIATAETPQSVIALLDTAGIRVVPTGIAHGTVTAVIDGTPYEITTLRLDIETFGRRARVAFTDDWVADAARRDFTINALYLDLDGTVFDPTGGLKDLRAGRVRFVGDARARIEEDVLRLLRYFRFHAWYGTTPPDPQALAACRALAPRVAKLSAERVWHEIGRLLRAANAPAVIDLMAEHDVLAQVLPELTRRDALHQIGALEAARGLVPDPIRRLAAGLETDLAGVEKLARRLRLARAEWFALARRVQHRDAMRSGLTQGAMRRLLYDLGAETYGDLVLINWARDGGAIDDRARLALLDAAAGWRKPRFPLTGDDVLACGITKGEDVGALLRAIEDWWLDGGFASDRAACLAELDKRARDSRA